MNTGTTLQSLLNIDLPIVQAPMAGVQDSALAIAVCEAGGLGSLPCAMLSPDELRRELERITVATERPYNVNFFSHTPPEPDPAAEAAWREALAPYYAEFGLDPGDIPAGARRSPFDHATADVIEAFKPPVVSFHFGLPSAELVARVRDWGSKILASATTVAEARWLEAHGADVVIAQGLEAGGHRGHFLSNNPNAQLGTFALVPQVAQAVDIPVIAAGGIADARGVRAAMALGAVGTQVGTAYLLCPEARTRAVHRRALQSEAADHTVLTNLFSGGLARSMVNRVIRELGPVSESTPPFPLAAAAMAPLRAAAESRDSGDFSPLWCGQNAGGCREMPAAEQTRALIADLTDT